MGKGSPSVYSIAAHRGFADALVAGLIPRYREDRFGLARLTLLLPSRRTVRTVTEAFVRACEGGLLLPRMAVVGDLDIDETLGPLLDPIGAGADMPPACDPAWPPFSSAIIPPRRFTSATRSRLARALESIANASSNPSY